MSYRLPIHPSPLFHDHDHKHRHSTMYIRVRIAAHPLFRALGLPDRIESQATQSHSNQSKLNASPSPSGKVCARAMSEPSNRCRKSKVCKRRCDAGGIIVAFDAMRPMLTRPVLRYADVERKKKDGTCSRSSRLCPGLTVREGRGTKWRNRNRRKSPCCNLV